MVLTHKHNSFFSEEWEQLSQRGFIASGKIKEAHVVALLTGPNAPV
jgi:hypothetical protein